MKRRYLLDTNIVSEPIRPLPNSNVLGRIQQHRHEIATASLVWHELLFGCQRLPQSRKRQMIEAYLHNVVEQCCALTTAPLITPALVQRALRVPALEALSYADAKHRFERNYLVQLLKLTDGNVADAARIAERNRTEFYRLLQKHQLAPEMFRGAARQ